MLADGHFVARSLDESRKKGMNIRIKTIDHIKRIGKGPETKEKNNYLRTLSDDFAFLFPLLHGLILELPAMIRDGLCTTTGDGRVTCNNVRSVCHDSS